MWEPSQKYEQSIGRFTGTDLGRIDYVTYNSMMVYKQHLHLRPVMSTLRLELFRVFALSNEFKLLPIWFYCLFESFILILHFRSSKRHVLNLRSVKLDNGCLILGMGADTG